MSDHPIDPASFDSMRPYGELYIDTDGKAHFVMHMHSKESYEDVEISIRKFVAVLQSQLDRQDECPFNPNKGDKSDK